MYRHLTQICRIAFLEPAIGQAKILGSLVPSRNQVAGDINAWGLLVVILTCAPLAVFSAVYVI
jgi:hypothetical protein